VPGLQGTSIALYNLLQSEGAHSKKNTKKYLVRSAAYALSLWARFEPPYPLWSTTLECQGSLKPNPCAIQTPQGSSCLLKMDPHGLAVMRERIL
jgi:hypothetical protein